jgi:NADPH:quinone reductase-like Zn-dependent oxidoreductase
MKATVITGYGGPELFEYIDLPDPAPADGEIRVRAAAASINPVDILERTGATRAWRPLKFPAILGWDVSGTVDRVGAGVSGFAVGDRVCAWAYHTYAELCVAKATLFTKVPGGMELADAAALPLVTVTGGQLVTVGTAVHAGQTVLVSGANGGVGRSAVFAARSRGATVIAGVQRKQLSQAESIGAHQIVALDDDQAIRSLPPVDVVANAVRGKTAAMLMSKVKPDGIFVSVTGPPDNAKDYPKVKVVPFVSKQDSAFLASMVEAVARGELAIPIDRRVPLKDAGAAHAAVEKGGIGKVLLVP